MDNSDCGSVCRDDPRARQAHYFDCVAERIRVQRQNTQAAATGFSSCGADGQQTIVNLDAIDKMDQALLNLDKMSLKIVGNRIGIHPLFDVSLFRCLDSDELEAVLSYLVGEGYIHESPGDTAEETRLYFIEKRL